MRLNFLGEQIDIVNSQRRQLLIRAVELHQEPAEGSVRLTIVSFSAIDSRIDLVD